MAGEVVTYLIELSGNSGHFRGKRHDRGCFADSAPEEQREIPCRETNGQVSEVGDCAREARCLCRMRMGKIGFTQHVRVGLADAARI